MADLRPNSSSLTLLSKTWGRLIASKRQYGRRFVLPFAILAALFTTGVPAQQVYPNRPIRLIVPAAAGGQPDIVGRLVANELGKQTGQQVIVDNRAGAGGIIGTDIVAKAPADGYTFGSAPFTFVLNPSMYVKLPYDSVRDFQPVILSTAGPNVLAATLSLPVKSVQELIDLARAQPGKLSYGSTTGGSQLLAVELLKSLTGIQITQVSYKSIQQAILDVIGGQVHIVCDNLGSILPHVKGAKLRALGITTLKRWTVVPELPTLSETGLPGFEIVPWGGYILPAGTPREVVTRLNAEINKALQSPTVIEKLTALGSFAVGGTPEQHAEQIKRETEKWAKVIKAAGIKPQ